MPIRAHQKGTGAGELGARPGDYALGSAQSRAAARAALEQRLAGRKKLDIVFLSSVPFPHGEGVKVGEWQEGAGGIPMRFSWLPAGMTIEEAERIVAERGKGI